MTTKHGVHAYFDQFESDECFAREKDERSQRNV